MFTPEEMERMPKELEKLYSELEWRIMSDIVRRIKINGDVTRSADWQIHRWHELGESKKVIKQAIQDALDLSDHEVNRIYSDAIASGYVRNEELYMVAGKRFIPFTENMVLQQMISAIRKQTAEEFKNITQSMGFAVNVNGKIEFTELAEFYQKTLDGAMLDITSGAFDYNTVIRRTIETLTNSGLRTVSYATGWSNRVEVAARRAIMTGITQVTGKINEQNAEELETDYFEVSWHADARPTHQEWQGRVYSKKELETICGLGTGDGLAGWNCRHTYYPFIPGISERNWPDEELERLNTLENTPKEWNGKEYTSYEASQKQRQMERNIRAQKQKINLMELAEASKDDILAAKSRCRKAMSDYVDFSTAMGLPQQKQRLRAGDKSLHKKQRNGEMAKLGVTKAGTEVKSNHRRYIDTIPMEMVEEALDDLGNQIRNMDNEYAIVIDMSGNVVEFIGDGDSVGLYDVNLKHAYVLHNHPAINGILSFGADDFYFLREHQDVTMLCVNESYNYRVKVLKNISDLSYNSLYREAMERYGVFEDYQHGVFEILKERGYVEYARTDINKRTAGKGR